jgi:hypothetical protein
MLLEMGAIKGKRFVVFTDNTTTERGVKNRKSKNKAENTKLKEIQRLLVCEDIDILGKRVSSGTNTADRLSRGETVTFQMPYPLKSELRLFAPKLLIISAVVTKIKHLCKVKTRN